MRARAGLATLALALPGLAFSACAAASPAVVEVTAPSEPSAAPSAGPAGMDDGPAGAGCSWTAQALWARDARLPLCFDKEGACFATIPSPFEGQVHLWLPPGETAKTGGRLDLGADGIRLRAWTDAELLVLYPKDPTVFGQIAIPRDAEKIRADSVIDRSLDLSLRPESGFSPRGGALRARVACTGVVLTTTSHSDESIRGAIGAAISALGERTLPAGQALSISGSASGPVMADVTPEDADSRVELLEQSGGRSRILWWRGDLVLFGWVDTTALGPAPSGPAYGEGYGSGRGRLPPSRSPGTRCRRDLSLFAQVHESRRRVGVIEKGTVFDRSLSTAGGAFVSVELRSSSFKLAPSSLWLVPADALKGCE